MKKFFRNLHIWLSIPFGLIITIICFTGAMLVFEDEIMEVCKHELYYVNKVEGTALPVSQLIEKVSATLPDSVSVTGVTIFANQERAYQMNLSKPRRASLYVDQYTGEVKGRNERAAFFDVMFRAHRWLLDSMKPDGGVFVGKLVVGVSTLMMVIVLISGLIVWLPRSSKALKKTLKISVTKGSKRFFYDLHIAGGVYATIFLLAMALTGLTWSFPWYRTAFYAAFGIEAQQQMPHGQAQAKTQEKTRDRGERESGKKNGKGHGRTGRGGEHTDTQHGERAGAHHGERDGRHHDEAWQPVTSIFENWQKVYDQLAIQNAGYKQITLSDGTASVSFHRLDNRRAADRYIFDHENGEITETSLYDQQDKVGKMRGWIYSVHVGNFGGLFTRILAFLSALLGATLPLTGYYLWIKKLINRRKRLKVSTEAVTKAA